MIIENPEALKSWLTAVLAPLCDADPAALSKYVLALAKKEKPESELRTAMCDQLDVFLQHETKGFVDKLFITLETKSYLQFNPEPPGKTEEPPPIVVPPVAVPAVAPSSSDEAKAAEPARESTRTSSKVTSSTARSSDRSRRRSWSPRSRSRSRSRDRRRSRSRDRGIRDHRGRYDGDRRGRRSPVSSSSRRNRPRSRSPSGRRSRSPRNSTASSSRRARSPPPAKTSAGADPVAPDGHSETTAPSAPVVQSVVVAPSAQANKFRCRDYDEKGYCMRGDLCPYDHGADPVVLEDVELNSMLNYNRPPPTAVVVVAGPPPVVPAAATGAAVVPPPVVGAPHLRGPPPSLAPGEPYNPDAPGISWPPPPPHHMVGPPGIVPLRGSGGYRGGPPPPMPFGPPHHHRLPPPHLRGHMRGHGPHHLGPPPGHRGHGGPPPMGLLGTAPHPSGPAAGQRELISVPTAGLGGLAEDGSGGEPHGGLKRNISDAGMDDSQTLKRGHFDYNRLGGQTGPNQQQGQQPARRPFDPTNCCLEVKKIPRGLNNISVLNNHFSKFGKIVNLQVSFNGDPEGALVTFASHSEAQAAYRSTEAVLNNRFIKVFWHNKESPEKQENVPPTSKVPIKERLGSGGRPVLTQSQAAVPDEAAVKEATEAKEKEREKALAAIKRSQEILAAKEALKKKQEEQKREATKLQVDLQRRKQELLDKQLQQQRVLIERLEKGKAGSLKPEERAQVMQTVRNLQESIEKLKRDLQLHSGKEGAVSAKPAPPAVSAKAVEEAKKEKLDAEIELYQKQMEGSDTTELQRRLQELNTIISQSHRGHPSAIRRGVLRGARAAVALRGTRGRAGALSASRGAGRGRGRGGYFAAAHVSVDRRPTQLKATGFDASQQGDVLAHFANFGEVVDYQVDETVPFLTIRYKSRKDAEMAMAQAGKSFPGGVELQVHWHLPPGSAGGRKVKLEEGDEGADVGAAESGLPAEGEAAGAEEAEEEEEETEGLEDLLNYEEDDEDEERSWRR